MTVNSNNKNLGPKTLEGQATQGSQRTMSMTMANATGSCTNGSFSMMTTAYISGIHKQRAYCPLSMATMPGTMSGGCKPTFHGSTTGNPMAGDPNNLEMYLLTQSGMGAQPPGPNSPGSLLERGNINWLYKPQADPLFEPPPDFTKAS